MPTYRPLPEAADQRPWLTLRYLRRLVYENRIPHAKVGGKVLVADEDIDALERAGRVEPGTAA